MHKRTKTIALVGVVILVAAVLFARGGSLGGIQTGPTPTSIPNIPIKTTLVGIYTCLPHRNTKGPVTLECALGLKADDGYHYALDTSLVPDIAQDTPTGTRLEVHGLLVPIEQISANTWQKYDIQGIMQVEVIQKR
jgi:hypothetical protein